MNLTAMKSIKLNQDAKEVTYINHFNQTSIQSGASNQTRTDAQKKPR